MFVSLLYKKQKKGLKEDLFLLYGCKTRQLMISKTIFFRGISVIETYVCLFFFFISYSLSHIFDNNNLGKDYISILASTELFS